MRESTSITIRTNSFAITKLPPMHYHQYTKFVPKIKSPEKRVRLFHSLQTQIAPELFKTRAVYDGDGIAYCPVQLALPDGNAGTYDLNFKTTAGPNPSSGIVAQLVKITRTIGEMVIPSTDVKDMTAKQKMSDKAVVATNLLQLIVRQRPNMDCKNTRAYFPGKERYPIGNGEIEIWRGFFQSVRPSLGKMILTIDTCITAVYAGGPLDNLCGRFAAVNNIRDLNFKTTDRTFRKLESFLSELLIKYNIGNNKESRTKKIYGLVSNAGRYSFTNDRNETVTVQEHFKSAHGIHLAHPSIIGVRISSNKAPRPIVIPLEVCVVIPGQFYKRKLADDLAPQMLKVATLKPEERLRRITDAVKRYKDSEFVVESQMAVDITPLEARGKLLNTPTITYGENVKAKPQTGAWNVVAKKLHTPKQLNSWAVLNFCPDVLSNPQCQDYIRELSHCCKKLGMDPTPPVVIMPGQPSAVEKSLDGTMRTAVKASGEPPEILLIILPKLAAPIKSQVKHWGDIKHGVLTQCIRLDRFLNKRTNDQYWNNVALKINARLQGQNWHTNDSPIMKELALERFMIIGADVSHPAPKMAQPSITSLVYSLDACATSYGALTHLQEPRVEGIQDLRDMVKKALCSFRRRWGKFPVRLFFYRDGVSEGELAEVGGREVAEIKAAIEELGQGGVIKLTFIVVTKRHHAVFFPTSDRTSDKKGNCLPGSVVDHDVTHPAMRDFYLQSHAAIQGTSRSSHYIVLLDENINFDMERLQALSYALCHVYAKATRAVSIPAPIYYADLVCSRGMIHLDPNARLTFDDTDDASSTSSNKDKDRKDKKNKKFELQPWLDAFRDVNERMSDRMYFL